MEETTYECPQCMGTKKYFNGEVMVHCSTCNDNGEVSPELYDIFNGEEDLI